MTRSFTVAVGMEVARVQPLVVVLVDGNYMLIMGVLCSPFLCFMVVLRSISHVLLVVLCCKCAFYDVSFVSSNLYFRWGTPPLALKKTNLSLSTLSILFLGASPKSALYRASILHWTIPNLSVLAQCIHRRSLMLDVFSTAPMEHPLD